MSAQLTEADTIYPVDGNVTEHASLAEALVAAQKEMPAVEPSKANPAFKGAMYVTLGQLIAAVRPVLNRNGIAVVQMPAQDDGGRPALITRLLHESGDAAESVMPLVMDKPTAQGLGSALTYAKRYALASALAIADQEDDDGNAATQAAAGPAAASTAQLDTLRNALSWLLPPGADTAALVAVGEACGEGPITVEVAKATVAAIKARKDLEGQEPDQAQTPAVAGSHDPEPPAASESSLGAPAAAPGPTPAESVEADYPADTEGLE